MSDSLWPHGQQHARLPCLSPSLRPCLNSNPVNPWCCPTSPPLLPHFLLPSIIPSIRVFSNESTLCIRWPKYWSFSFSISPFSEYWGLLSFRIGWFNPLALQGILRSLLQHCNSKASILWCSAFFMVQLSYLYMTTGKTIALTRWTFVERVMSLLLIRFLRLSYLSSKEKMSFNFMAAGNGSHYCHLRRQHITSRPDLWGQPDHHTHYTDYCQINTLAPRSSTVPLGGWGGQCWEREEHIL